MAMGRSKSLAQSKTTLGHTKEDVARSRVLDLKPVISGSVMGFVSEVASGHHAIDRLTHGCTPSAFKEMLNESMAMSLFSRNASLVSKMRIWVVSAMVDVDRLSRSRSHCRNARGPLYCASVSWGSHVNAVFLWETSTEPNHGP